MTYDFDRFLRYDELTQWLHDAAAAYPTLMAVESYGTSYEGRDLWIATVTDTSTGAHDTKPAHWVDANIHSVEVTGGVAALYLLHHLVTGFSKGDRTVTEALRTRTFYVVPRVNPDGVESALADSPKFRRSSMRPWPWSDAHQWPGLVESDINGDGRILTMRIPDPHGGWVAHPDDPRVMAPVSADGITETGIQRYRLLAEGTIADHDGFTVPTPRAPQGLDMNRNFPAGWGTSVSGSGDHPLSEPEIDALVRAVVARPNVCGYNAFHTSGGVLLRPSSTSPDSAISPVDLWVWKELGARGTELTGYNAHSVFEDFTFDKKTTMSGAADDWAYEHLGVYSWTTEFWDAGHAATGEHAPTDIWTMGPTVETELAVARWSDQHGELYVPWQPFDHPQLGPIEIGGADWFHLWANTPAALLQAEVAPHAVFAVHQALTSPRLEIVQTRVIALGADTWRVEIGIANTGWLPTTVSHRAFTDHLVRPVTAELDVPAGVTVVGSANRRQYGQLDGRSRYRLNGGASSDGTPDRVLAVWTVNGAAGSMVGVLASHQRAGSAAVVVTLG